MNQRAVRLACALAVACCLYFCAAAVARAQSGHTLRGKVRNSAGAAVIRATVSLETGTGATIQQTVTGNEGDFAFTSLTATSYVVIVNAPDYDAASERVEFIREVDEQTPGETRIIEITLQPKGGVRPPRPGLNFVQNVPQAARDAFESALKLGREGKTEESLAALRQAVKIFPDYFDARFLLANELVKQGKLGDAITQLNEAQRINAKDDRVWHVFGTVLMRQGKYAVAARVFAEASRLNPNDPQYPLLAGTALIEQAALTDASKAEERNYAFTEAEKSLTRAYQLSNKKLAAAHLQLARLYEKKGDRARAA
ncbi:MAG TPA: tetratricopeptide repeat protein, partial [Pyrinomonadaceae bacterium]|nr:tetratricopeptide repeat protein [Pyrinomonadaceae bacterium]